MLPTLKSFSPLRMFSTMVKKWQSIVVTNKTLPAYLQKSLRTAYSDHNIQIVQVIDSEDPSSTKPPHNLRKDWTLRYATAPQEVSVDDLGYLQVRFADGSTLPSIHTLFFSYISPKEMAHPLGRYQKLSALHPVLSPWLGYQTHRVHLFGDAAKVGEAYRKERHTLLMNETPEPPDRADGVTTMLRRAPLVPKKH